MSGGNSHGTDPLLMCPVKDLTCPRRLRKSDFLDLLRSTFPQLTGGFDIFTVDSNKKLMPLKLQTLTEEEIQHSIRSTGKERSMLYIRVQRAKTLTSPEQLPPPETTDENPADTSRDDNRTHVSSDHSPVEKVESNKVDHQSGNSRRQQHVKVEEDGQQCGLSQDSSGSSSAHAAAESEGEHGDDDEEEEVEGEDDGDDEWKPDKNGQWTQDCDVCGKSVTNFRALSRHKLLHVGIKYFCCQVCGKHFRTSARLKLHKKIHSERDKAFLCDVCCKTFYTRGELMVHLRTHTKATITCTECGKGLSSKGALNRHMIVDAWERPYQCPECGLRFNGMSTLTAHMKIHTGVKSFVCGVCGKACARKAYLTVHMRTHSGERPYECTVCERAFTQSHCLKTHMKSHQVQKAAEEGLKSS